MSDAETIHAAIVKLESLKAESTSGVWTILDGGDRFIAEEDPLGDGPLEYIVTEPVEFRRGADCDLIEVLHRTLDAQLAILRAAQDDYTRYGGKPSQFFANDVNLARAILGEDH